VNSHIPRGKQCRPTRSELASAWRRLREAAEAGDLNASAFLIFLSNNYFLVSLAAQLPCVSSSVKAPGSAGSRNE